MLFVSSLIMAIAVEHSGFHHRLSLHMISAIGASQRRIMLGESQSGDNEYNRLKFDDTMHKLRLHACHDVPLNVDLQHGGHGADGAHSGLHHRGHVH